MKPIKNNINAELIKIWNAVPTKQHFQHDIPNAVYTSVSWPPGRGPVPGPGINYTGPQEVPLEVVILVF